MDNRQAIREGKVYLGIEFGSTRIKAVLTGPDQQPIAIGSHTWKDKLVDGMWSYSLEAVRAGMQDAYLDMKRDAQARWGETVRALGGLGVSAMMHGYLPFDGEMNLLTPFRTWRNTITGEAAAELTELLGFNIPQRWSIAHLYQAVLKGEEHLPRVRFLTTLAGYAHWLLSGEKVLGVGDAAGVFPIDSGSLTYDPQMLAKVEARLAPKGYPWRLRDILPAALPAGAKAGTLTAAGAALLDPSGDLQPGAILCPPEGDAGTGMVATDAVAARTGNVSAGTSIFAMVVLEKPLSKLYPEIDIVATPDGRPVAMVHCNTCTSDLNAWVGLLREALETFGAKVSGDELYTRLFQLALQGRKDCGSVTSFNCFSGEPVLGTADGVPMLIRRPEDAFTLPDFMRAQINSALATLAVGMETLTVQEKVAIEKIMGHGGLFKTPEVGQRLLAAAIRTPVTVMETAGEGGAWGIALLAAYAALGGEQETLADWLDRRVFADAAAVTLAPEAEDVAGFDAYLARYRAAIPAEAAACRALRS